MHYCYGSSIRKNYTCYFNSSVYMFVYAIWYNKISKKNKKDSIESVFPLFFFCWILFVSAFVPFSIIRFFVAISTQAYSLRIHSRVVKHSISCPQGEITLLEVANGIREETGSTGRTSAVCTCIISYSLGQTMITAVAEDSKLLFF